MTNTNSKLPSKKPDLQFANKLALVTGGSGNIGAAVSKRLSQEGAAVLVHYHSNSEGAQSVVHAIRQSGGMAEAIKADLSIVNGPLEVVNQINTAFGGTFLNRLDILINNAGSLEFGALTSVTDQSFDRMLNLNIRAPFQLSREAASRMKKSGWGRIVNIGSVFGESTTVAGLSIYSGTKFAIRGLTRAWSRDLGAFNITVNCVQPALVQPEPHPTDGQLIEAMHRYSSVNRLGKPEEVAHAVSFLASVKSSYVNGECLTVDGGWSA